MPGQGLRSHTATSWLSLGCVSAVLAPLVHVAPPAASAAVCAALGTAEGAGAVGGVPKLEGFAQLAPAHQAAVSTALRAAATEGGGVDPPNSSSSSSGAMHGLDSKTTGDAAAPASPDTQRKQGRVAWRFGGHLCYGELLPRQETATHWCVGS
jgi:hypothetical protein